MASQRVLITFAVLIGLIALVAARSMESAEKTPDSAMENDKGSSELEAMSRSK